MLCLASFNKSERGERRAGAKGPEADGEGGEKKDEGGVGTAETRRPPTGQPREGSGAALLPRRRYIGARAAATGVPCPVPQPSRPLPPLLPTHTGGTLGKRLGPGLSSPLCGAGREAASLPSTLQSV